MLTCPVLGLGRMRLHRMDRLISSLITTSGTGRRHIHRDHRARLSSVWLPTGGITASLAEDAHSKLIRAGYLRQGHSGIFHMLPLGQRVLEKLEKLIERHMRSLGASRVALSSLSSQALWEKTGRLTGYGSELFKLSDRKNTSYLLAPTHEEEITSLVSRTVDSYKDLPLRLYQITRKYRDELRPRHGLLRSREFIMKDLYTFDLTVKDALATYEEVRAVYRHIFDELKIPYLVAEASSGDIGGDLSHEFHLPTAAGEDVVISCDTCDYVSNEELAVARHSPTEADLIQRKIEDPELHDPALAIGVWRGISKDRTALINVWYPSSLRTTLGTQPRLFSDSDVNVPAVKAFYAELDSSIVDPVTQWRDAVSNISTSEPATEGRALKLINIFDSRVAKSVIHSASEGRLTDVVWPEEVPPSPSLSSTEWIEEDLNGKRLNLLKVQPGENCSRCTNGVLSTKKAVELGHTFHLGTRYSLPLSAGVSVPSSVLNECGSSGNDRTTQTALQMGCHGIGLSRIIGAVTDHLADSTGLNWPRVIAPFEVVIIPGRGSEEDSVTIYDQLSTSGSYHASLPEDILDAVLDDRAVSLPWKLKDADLVGYPIVVVLGRKWSSDKLVEVQCRRLNVKALTTRDELPGLIKGLLSQL